MKLSFIFFCLSCQLFLDDVQSFKAFVDLFESDVYLIVSMGSHQRKADEGTVRSYGRSHNRIYKDALFKQVAGYLECLFVVSYK